MRLPSQRQASSHRRKLAVVLALLTPTLAQGAELGNPLRVPGSIEEPLRPIVSQIKPPIAQPRTARAIEQLELVPLPMELSGPAGAAMPLLGPIAPPAVQPTEALQNRSPDDDSWFPRSTRGASRATDVTDRSLTVEGLEPSAKPASPESPSLRNIGPVKSGRSIHSTFQILPSQFSELEATDPTASLQEPDESVAPSSDETGSRGEVNSEEVDEPSDASPEQRLQAVTDPEQNEPSGIESLEAGDDGPLEEPLVLEIPADPDPHHRDPAGAIEIRRFQLHDKPQSKAESAGIAARAVSNRSARRVTVGDVPPDGDDLLPDGGPDEDTRPANQPTPTNPIHGDRITAAGELILASGSAASGLPVLPQTARLQPTIQRALRYYWGRPEDAAERTHWGMMHSIMIFDKDTQILNRRQRYNAVAWMAGNNPCRNQLLFARDQQGIVVRTGVGLQGHQGQLLAIFGLINVPLHYPVSAARQKYAVADILEREMLDCRSGNELTFTLIALAHYTDSDTSWVAGDRQNWDVQRVIREELSQPIIGAACGGTHRLMGFAHALRRRRAEGKPITDQWDRADRYVSEFVDYTWTLQNRDGSMSTGWFERSEDNGKMDRKIQTTGHMLEFLLSTVADAELQSPKMLRTVDYLANTLYTERGHQWQIGPKGHAVRALAMYYQRVFGESAPWRSEVSEQNAAAGTAAQRPLR